MTTQITISPAGHHVLVKTIDHYKGDTKVSDIKLLQPAFKYVDGEQVATGQGPLTVYSTTSRTIEIVDLEPDDPSVLAASQKATA